MPLELISQNRSFNGVQRVYSHHSDLCNGVMRFGVYLPPAALSGQSCPVVTYLSGLSCTEENVITKAGAQRVAAELSLILVTPDTSPRGQNIAEEDDSYDFGSGAGFYVDATQAPWSAAYKMYSYVTCELQSILAEHFPEADTTRQGITGHSMGGHGALVLHLKRSDLYRSCSAFSPICAPIQCPWGQKAFAGYLGDDVKQWSAWDATELIKTQPTSADILVDQGTADQFLDEQLKPDLLESACQTAGQKLTLRRQDGYDHGYYFIATFIEDHLRHHHTALAV